MKGKEYIRNIFRDAHFAQAAETAQDGAFLIAALELLKETESPLREEAFTKIALRGVRRRDSRGERRAA